jgi:hypothetical protein
VCNEFQDIFNQAHTSGPITRAQAKLIKYKVTTQLALSLLKSETENIDSLCAETIALNANVKKIISKINTCLNFSGVN